MTLRLRILVAVVAPAVLLLVALSAVVWVRVRADRLADLDASLLARAAALASVVERDDDGRWESEPLEPLVTGLTDWRVRAHPRGPFIASPPPTTEDAPGAPTPEQVEAATRVYALDVEAPPQPWPKLRPALVAHVVDEDLAGDRRVRAVYLVRAEAPRPKRGALDGTSEAPLVQVDVAASLDPLDAAQRALATTLAEVGAALAALAALVGAALSRRIAGPLAAMADAAERVRAPSATPPLARTGRGDEVDRLAATLNDAFLRTFAAWEEQRRFSADASHELRTPLAALRAQAEVMLRAPRSADEYREALSAVLEGAQRMQRVVEGLLLLARADGHAPRARWLEVDLGLVVDDAVRAARASQALLGASGVALEVAPRALPAGGCTVLGDADQLAVVVSNLIDNAVRHARARVAVTVTADAAGTVLCVDDDGAGIPPALRARVFERFFRVDAARSAEHGGAGLGLALVRTLVELHGGSVRVEDAPLGGARLTVRLPRPPSPEERSAHPSSRLQQASLS